MLEKDIPKATARRLTLYQHAFQSLLESGKEKVSSSELSDILKIDPATIRRDFSYFGSLGKRGYGYDIQQMSKFFNQVLNTQEAIHVAIIGLGNLGEALLKENVRQDNQVEVVAAFDVKDDLVGTNQEGIPVYSMEELEERFPKLGLETAILSVPNDHAQGVADQLANTSCKGILNFTNVRVTVPKDIRVHNVNLVNEIKVLNYFIKEAKGN